MRRTQSEALESAGSDSFLDIVANIVGILIILVMVVAVRLKNAPAVDEPVEDPAAGVAVVDAAETDEYRRRLHALVQQEKSVTSEIAELDQQSNIVDRELKLRGEQRFDLGVLAEEGQRELEGRKDRLGAQQRELFDAQRDTDDLVAELDRLHREIEANERKKKAPIKLTAYSTPLGQVVHQKEVHFQLRSGYIAYVPLEELLRRLRSDAQRLVGQLRETRQVTGTVGPVEGFRMRYTFQRVTVAATPTGSGRTRSFQTGGSYAQLSSFTLLPVEGTLGETIDDAVRPTSSFRSELGVYEPTQTVVTLWVYPDSFAAFREIRKQLYRLGYTIAARPLPAGAPIGGSPQGTKSVAQ